VTGDEQTMEELRERISAIDRAIVAAINDRLELVAHLKDYKRANGIAFLDPQREAALFEERVRENRGPLSEEGLRAFYAELLALVKRELAEPSAG
jgi:chorismate mutase/prephenate dehydratase